MADKTAPTLHCSLNSTRMPARADLLLRVKSPTTKFTKPSPTSGTRSLNKKRREYTDYAERLTSAVQARLAALDLPTPVTVNIKLAPEGTHSSYDFDDHAPATYPRNAIEAAIDDAIAHTPTPSALPDTPRDRLSAAQP